MKYAYYPGCSLHATSIEYDISTKAVAQALGIELEEIADWVCCGASSGHETSELLALALPAKNLLQAQKQNLDVMVCCAACYGRFRVANHEIKKGTRRAQVEEVVGQPYDGGVQVRHFLDILVNEYGLDDIGKAVTKKLADLKVASYYGCLLVRPPEVVAFDDPENPSLMDKLAATLGAQPVDWSYKTECCGASLSLTRTDVVLRLAGDILQSAKDAGADCLMVACPLCQSNLDLRQSQINKRYKTDFHLPVVYFTQLLGLGLGIPPQQLGLDKLIVSPAKVLETVPLS
jgi:heterodisulfide reductase subunit B2